MKPGPELDELVAEKVMGFSVCRMHHAQTGGFCMSCNPPRWETLPTGHVVGVPNGKVLRAGYVPRYSTDIAAAWEVAEEIKKRGRSWWMTATSGGKHKYNAAVREYPDRVTISFISADSMPEAICLAALKAVGITPKDC